MLAAGSQVGDYLVEHLLAQSPLGLVYSGQHTLLRTPITFELLRRSLTHDGTGLARFVVDLYGVNAILHPAALRVLAVGEIDDGQCYVVTERPDGPSLEQILEHEAALPPGAVLPVIEQLCHLLGQVHAAGIVHGGLNPARIVVLHSPPRPTIRVAGFGGVHLGSLAGKAYTAPEVRAGGRADVRADIYAVGVLLGRLVPFHDPLGPVVRQATADRPEDRHVSAGALFDAVRSAIGESSPWPAELSDPDRGIGAPSGREFGFEGIVTVRTALPASAFVPEAIAGEHAASEMETDYDPVTFRTPVDVQEMETDTDLGRKDVTPPPPSGAAVLAPDETLGELAADELEADEPAVRRVEPDGDPESLADALDDLFDDEGYTDQQPAPRAEEQVAAEEEVPDEPRTALFTPSALAGLVASARPRTEDETARIVTQPASQARPPSTPALEPEALDGAIEEEPTREAQLDGVPLEAVATGARPLARVKLVKVRATDLPEPFPAPLEAAEPFPEESPYLSIEIDGEPVEPEPGES